MKESCPKCNGTEIQEKLILIEAVWIYETGKDPREKCGMGLRADQVLPEYLGKPPLEQFIKGYICSKCETGFVSDAVLKDGYSNCGHRI